MKKTTKIVMTLCAIALLSACGLKGDLYMPKDNTVPTTSVHTIENSTKVQR